MIHHNHIPAGAVYYNQPNTVAVVFDPDGGHHEVKLLEEAYGNRFWCAGMIGPSPEWLVERIWNTWNEPSFDDESTYRAQLACFEGN